MSQFGTTENVSGHIEIHTLDKQTEAERQSLSNVKE
jgi:hypothetical protein